MDNGVALQESVSSYTHVSVEAIMECLRDGIFDQLRDYMRYAGIGATDASIITSVFELALYFFALDPVLKKELKDYLDELRIVVAGGHMDGMLSESEYTEQVADYLRGNKNRTDFNAYAIRQLEYYLSL